MRDLADLARNLIKDLFDSYRPELHYMRGPGPKWRAKHERPLRFGPDVVIVVPVRAGHAPVWLLTSICRAAVVILGIALFVGALLFISPTTSKADTSNCAQISDLPAARLRWAAARQIRVDSAQDEKKCRAYRNDFYDAVTARQAASICEDGIRRQRDLDLLDSEIDAFNNLIAAQCGGGWLHRGRGIMQDGPGVSKFFANHTDGHGSNERLVERIAAGDRRAMQVLYARHHLRVYRFVLRLVNDAAAAEDVTSDVFLEVWKHAGRFEGRSQASTWL